MHQVLGSYIPLVDFIADCMGENTEVVLHDLTDLHKSVVAIRHGQLSGRTIGSPITDLSLDILKTASFERVPYMANYQGVSKDGHQLKSSTYFIKDDTGAMIGMLCVNSDYHALCDARDQLGTLIAALGLQSSGPANRKLHAECFRSRAVQPAPRLPRAGNAGGADEPKAEDGGRRGA